MSSPETEVDEAPSSASGSLRERMEARSEELARSITEKFDVPGYEGILRVEMRKVGYKALRAIQQRHARQKDPATRDINYMADAVMMATEAIYEVDQKDPEKDKLIGGNEQYRLLASACPGYSPDLTDRQAFLCLIDDKRLPYLLGEWSEWSKAGQVEVDEEVRRDFSTTP